ncbi:hypothetical protein RN346_10215 [Halomonas sp. PAMB 3232]|uniref:hypothetical protein n=1 Tax=Halomonas sp. PAMB 3232 TaxID=3075221 RepID=UPI0028A2D628|nr:hypothetical protein [Halomonas sp. PAMB 3232]WNL37686.1 hypothetical protein RN346_10215 [Halomonas sp. PAMB 3232]
MANVLIAAVGTTPMYQNLPVISRSAFFSRRVFPFLWLSVVGFIFLVGLITADSFTLFLLIPLIMLVAGWRMFKKVFAGLADRVYDGGDHLIFVYGERHETIKLKDVMNVNYAAMSSPDKVTLTLREAAASCRASREVAFLPIRRKFGFAEISFKRLRLENHQVDELIERIDQARRAE